MEKANPYKIRSFQAAINAIKGLDYPLKSGKDAQSVRQTYVTYAGGVELIHHF